MNSVVTEIIQSATKKGMTVFDYSVDDDSSLMFQKLVGKEGKVISIMPTRKTLSLDNVIENTHVDVLYMNVQGKTLPFLGAAEEVLKRDRPIIFISVNTNIIQQHGYNMKDVRDFLLSVGYMNMKLAEGYYAFTYEFHPSKVLL